MKSGTTSVEDTEENRQICRKYCGVCPTYRHNALDRCEPSTLFCARGESSSPTRNELNCCCPASEIITRP